MPWYSREKDPDQVRAEYRARRRRQGVIAAGSLLGLALLAVGHATGAGRGYPLAHFPVTGAELSAFGLLLAADLLTRWNWRCPACGAFLSRQVKAGVCEQCGASLTAAAEGRLWGLLRWTSWGMRLVTTVLHLPLMLLLGAGAGALGGLWLADHVLAPPSKAVEFTFLFAGLLLGMGAGGTLAVREMTH